MDWDGRGALRREIKMEGILKGSGKTPGTALSALSNLAHKASVTQPAATKVLRRRPLSNPRQLLARLKPI